MENPQEESPLLEPIALAAPGTAPENATGDDNTTTQLNTELLALAQKYRILIPFAALLLIKIILDNAIPFVFIVLTTYGLIKIKRQLELQIALKIKSNSSMFVYLLCVSSFLVLLILIGIQISGLPDHLTARLLLSYGSVKDKPTAAFLHTLWCCVIMDSLLQAMALFTKCVACLCIGSQSFQCSSLKNLLKYEFWRDMSRVRAPSSASSASSNSFDIENQQRPATATGVNASGGGGVLTQELLSQLMSNGIVSSFSDGLRGIARRTNSNASNTPMVTGSSNTSSSSSNLHRSYSAVHDHDSDTPSHDPQQSQEYLQRIRLCTLLDILSFCYRTAVPVAAWVDYFSSGGMGYVLLPIFYCVVKLFDLVWKFQAAFEGIKNYFTQTLEYGHYSTHEEYPTPASGVTSLAHLKECPVCFDTPIVRPVTLDCHHIFCEICILEWLDKEKTCPICRAEVKCVSPLVGSLKEEIANCSFLVT